MLLNHIWIILWRNLIHVADPTKWDKAWLLLLYKMLLKQNQV